MKRLVRLISIAMVLWATSFGRALESAFADSATLEISLAIDDKLEVLNVNAHGDVRKQVVDFCSTRTDDSEVQRCSRNLHDHAVKMMEDGRTQGNCQRRNLLVTAHPDDEVIFGFDSLVEGTEEECWTIVCVTSGFNASRREQFEYAMEVVRNEMDATLSRYEIWNYLNCVDCVPLFPVGCRSVCECIYKDAQCGTVH